MRNLLISRIEDILQHAKPSDSRWFSVYRKYSKTVTRESFYKDSLLDILKLDSMSDEQLIELFEHIIRRLYIQS